MLGSTRGILDRGESRVVSHRRNEMYRVNEKRIRFVTRWETGFPLTTLSPLIAMPIIWIQSFANVDLLRPLEQIVPNDAEIGFTRGNETFRFSLFLSLFSSPDSLVETGINRSELLREISRKTCRKREILRCDYSNDLIAYSKKKGKKKDYRTISNERDNRGGSRPTFRAQR